MVVCDYVPGIGGINQLMLCGARCETSAAWGKETSQGTCQVPLIVPKEARTGSLWDFLHVEAHVPLHLRGRDEDHTRRTAAAKRRMSKVRRQEARASCASWWIAARHDRLPLEQADRVLFFHEDRAVHRARCTRCTCLTVESTLMCWQLNAKRWGACCAKPI